MFKLRRFWLIVWNTQLQIIYNVFYAQLPVATYLAEFQLFAVRTLLECLANMVKVQHVLVKIQEKRFCLKKGSSFLPVAIKSMEQPYSHLRDGEPQLHQSNLLFLFLSLHQMLVQEWNVGESLAAEATKLKRFFCHFLLTLIRFVVESLSGVKTDHLISLYNLLIWMSPWVQRETECLLG